MMKRAYAFSEDEEREGFCKYCGESLQSHETPLCLWAREALGIEEPYAPALYILLTNG
jgi:hypothetical protein